LEMEDVEVYISPPANMQMVYPCIRIARDVGNTAFADNNPYRHQPRYQLTAIDEEPNSPLYKVLASLPRSRHERSFPADNLNHDVFTMFFEEEE
jgi:hypothetical protein